MHYILFTVSLLNYLLYLGVVKIAIIDLALPTLEQKSGPQQEEIKDLTVLVLSINSEGFQIKTSEKEYPIIKIMDGDFNYMALVEELTEVKKKFPKLEDVIISPSSEILYHVIVKVLDNCREIGFPNYSISG